MRRGEMIMNLYKMSKNIRKKLIMMHYRSKASHIGSALSIVDILVVLYFKVLNIDPNYPEWKERDRFILSKGHAASALYCVLAEKGFFEEKLLDGYCINGGKLSEHPDKISLPGIEASTGSLGHGLPIGVGMAFAAKKDKKEYKIFVLMSDGECEEGSVWEAATTAGRLKLDNLVTIVDYNKLQAYDRTDNIQPIKSVKEKFENSGWSVCEIDGHNFDSIEKSLKTFSNGKPTLIIASTIKGKGIKEMEDKMEWHYKSPNEENLNIFLKELGESL
jgi:transketolase